MENADTALSTNERPASMTFASLLKEFRARLNEDLRRYMQAKRRDGEDATFEAVPLIDALSILIESGGKRLRPALVHFAFRACGGTDTEIVRPLEVATELLHTYLLVHDDIMDHADVRRGTATAHVRFRNEHRRNNWRGNSEHYGTSMAILVGNLAHAQAHERFTQACQAAPDEAALRDTFSTMEEEVIGGQLLEMRLAQEQDANAERLQRILQLKSGRYSVERPLQLGALLAGAPDDQIDTLTQYGSAAGGAFQLQDDLLGMFGDPDATGKPVGDDLREGKFTFLVYHTLQHASPDDRRMVQQALGTASLTSDEVQQVCDVMRQSGAVTRVQTMIDDRLTRAREVLDGAVFESDGDTFLHGLIDYLGERNQ